MIWLYLLVAFGVGYLVGLVVGASVPRGMPPDYLPPRYDNTIVNAISERPQPITRIPGVRPPVSRQHLLGEWWN